MQLAAAEEGRRLGDEFCARLTRTIAAQRDWPFMEAWTQSRFAGAWHAETPDLAARLAVLILHANQGLPRGARTSLQSCASCGRAPTR